MTGVSRVIAAHMLSISDQILLVTYHSHLPHILSAPRLEIP